VELHHLSRELILLGRAGAEVAEDGELERSCLIRQGNDGLGRLLRLSDSNAARSRDVSASGCDQDAEEQ
jgi:hypothetical protein